MALIVEDGTIVVDANSYCSVADADAYHTTRGNAAWAALDNTTKEQNLIKATDYISMFYDALWDGEPMQAGQSLAWPRRDVRVSGGFYIPIDIIPRALRHATAELAMKAASGINLFEDIGRETLSEKVGEIAVTYAQGSRRSTQFTVVDGWLSSFLGARGMGMIPISRA